MLKKLLSWKNLQNIRNQEIINFLSGDILELGCWEGFIPEFLKNKYKNNNYLGVDFRLDTINKLTDEFPKYHFIQHDLDEVLDLSWQEFDTVISTAVIEHIYNQKNFFITATKALKKWGKLIITTPSNFWNDIIYPLMCKFGYRWGNGVLSDHITIYNKDRFMVAANDFWLEIESFKFFEFFCNQVVIFRKK